MKGRGGDEGAGAVGYESGVGEGVVAVVGQGCVADGKGMVEAKEGEGIADLMEAFDGKGRDQ